MNPRDSKMQENKRKVSKPYKKWIFTKLYKSHQFGTHFHFKSGFRMHNYKYANVNSTSYTLKPWCRFKTKFWKIYIFFKKKVNIQIHTSSSKYAKENSFFFFFWGKYEIISKSALGACNLTYQWKLPRIISHSQRVQTYTVQL